jgi:hypothetical protein
MRRSTIHLQWGMEQLANVLLHYSREQIPDFCVARGNGSGLAAPLAVSLVRQCSLFHVIGPLQGFATPAQEVHCIQFAPDFSFTCTSSAYLSGFASAEWAAEPET